MKLSRALNLKALVFATAIVFVCAYTPKHGQPNKNKVAKQVIIGYVGGYRGLIRTDSIDVARLTHINYAFVDIKDNRAWLHNGKTDEVNLRRLAALKTKNPAL